MGNRPLLTSSLQPMVCTEAVQRGMVPHTAVSSHFEGVRLRCSAVGNRDVPHPMTGIEEVATCLIVLRKRKNQGHTSHKVQRDTATKSIDRAKFSLFPSCCLMVMIPRRNARHRPRTSPRVSQANVWVTFLCLPCSLYTHLSRTKMICALMPRIISVLAPSLRPCSYTPARGENSRT